MDRNANEYMLYLTGIAKFTNSTRFQQTNTLRAIEACKLFYGTLRYPDIGIPHNVIKLEFIYFH